MRNQDGTFAKGHPGYKPKSPLTNIKNSRKNRLAEIIHNIEENHLCDDLEALKPYERVKIWSELHEYIVPKLSRQAVELEVPESISELLALSPEQRRERIIQLQNLINDGQREISE